MNKKKDVEPIVNFLVVGAQKSGTTTLYAHLCNHPEISMAKNKEIHFFNNDKLFEQTESSPLYQMFFDLEVNSELRENKYQYYHSFFEDNAIERIRGEVTPAYMYNKYAPRRIWEYNPKMKLVVILRNPIDRAYSHWNMEKNRGRENLPFREALEAEAERCREALPSQNYRYSYLDRGYYVTQLREIYRFFKQEQILVLKYDDLSMNLDIVLNTLFQFLGVKKQPMGLSFCNKIKHKGCYSALMSAEDRKFLSTTYECEIACLEKILEWDCSDWFAY